MEGNRWQRSRAHAHNTDIVASRRSPWQPRKHLATAAKRLNRLQRAAWLAIAVSLVAPVAAAQQKPAAVPTAKPPVLPPPSETTRLLHQAIQNWNLPLAETFLAQGADINCRNCFSDGSTLLVWAVRQSNRDLVSFLLSRGAAINQATTGRGTTPLMAATSRAFVRWPEEAATIPFLLLSRGGDPALRSSTGETALHFLAAAGPGAVPQDLQWSEGFIEQQRRFFRLVNQLVARGADIKAARDDGSTVLHLAAESCNPDTVRTLLHFGADPAALKEDGRDARSIALSVAAQTARQDCNAVVSVLQSAPGTQDRKLRFGLDAPAAMPASEASPSADRAVAQSTVMDDGSSVSNVIEIAGDWQGVIRLSRPATEVMPVRMSFGPGTSVRIAFREGVEAMGNAQFDHSGRLLIEARNPIPFVGLLLGGRRMGGVTFLGAPRVNRWGGNYASQSGEVGTFVICRGGSETKCD